METLRLDVVVSDKGKTLVKDKIKVSALTEAALSKEIRIPGCGKYHRSELIRQLKTEWRHLGLLYEAQIVKVK